MLAMRLKRLEIKSQVEDGVGPVLSSASSSGASGGGASRPAHIRKIELLLEELVPLLPCCPEEERFVFWTSATASRRCWR